MLISLFFRRKNFVALNSPTNALRKNIQASENAGQAKCKLMWLFSSVCLFFIFDDFWKIKLIKILKFGILEWRIFDFKKVFNHVFNLLQLLIFHILINYSISFYLFKTIELFVTFFFKENASSTATALLHIYKSWTFYMKNKSKYESEHF